LKNLRFDSDVAGFSWKITRTSYKELLELQDVSNSYQSYKVLQEEATGSYKEPPELQKATKRRYKKLQKDATKIYKKNLQGKPN
jgi:hypothetical protein